ncbi:Rad9 [Aureococcus anophagefferens]|nr:Rad9 [Aureococcus anophagefferens]
MGAGGSAAHQRADGPPPPGTDPVFDKMVEDELARRKDQGGAAKPGASAPPVPGEDPVFDAMVKQEMERQKYEVDAFAGALGARDGRGPPSRAYGGAAAEPAGRRRRLATRAPRAAAAEPQSGYGDPTLALPGPAPAAAPAHGPPPWAHGDVGRDPYEPAPLGRGMATIQGANPPRQLGGRKDAQAAYAAELEAQMREKADRDRFHRNRDMAASRERLRGYPPSPTRDDGGAYGGGAHGGARSSREPTAAARRREPTAAARRRSLRRRRAAGAYGGEPPPRGRRAAPPRLRQQQQQQAQEPAAYGQGVVDGPFGPRRHGGGGDGPPPAARREAAPEPPARDGGAYGAYPGGRDDEPAADDRGRRGSNARERFVRDVYGESKVASAFGGGGGGAEPVGGGITRRVDPAVEAKRRSQALAQREALEAQIAARREAKEAEAAERRRQEAADLEEERRRDAEEKAKKDEEDRQQPGGAAAPRRPAAAAQQPSPPQQRQAAAFAADDWQRAAQRPREPEDRSGRRGAKATNRYDDERVRDSELDKAADDFERRVAAELERFQLDRERREGRKEVARRAEPSGASLEALADRFAPDATKPSIYDLAGVEPPAPVKDRDVRPPPEDWAEKSLAGNSSFVPLPADYKASAEFDGLNPAAREPEMNQVDEYLSPDAIADRWQRDHPVVADPGGAPLPNPIRASSDPAKAAASTAKFTGAAEQSLVGESVFHHFHDNDGLAALSGPNSLSPPRRAAADEPRRAAADEASDRQARKENILRPKTGSRPGTKDRARWSDESPFLPGGPPPPGTDPVFDRMVEAELANRVNTPRADGDPPADFFK